MAEGKATPHVAEVGDRIEHELLPGFVMKVCETRDCEVDPARPEPHLAYAIFDPDGELDWLCAYDVRAAVRRG